MPRTWARRRTNARKPTPCTRPDTRQRRVTSGPRSGSDRVSCFNPGRLRWKSRLRPAFGAASVLPSKAGPPPSRSPSFPLTFQLRPASDNVYMVAASNTGGAVLGEARLAPATVAGVQSRVESIFHHHPGRVDLRPGHELLPRSQLNRRGRRQRSFRGDAAYVRLPRRRHHAGAEHSAVRSEEQISYAVFCLKKKKSGGPRQPAVRAPDGAVARRARHQHTRARGGHTAVPL